MAEKSEKSEHEALSVAVNELKKKLDGGEEIGVIEAVKLLTAASKPAAGALRKAGPIPGQTCDSFC